MAFTGKTRWDPPGFFIALLISAGVSITFSPIDILPFVISFFSLAYDAVPQPDFRYAGNLTGPFRNRTSVGVFTRISIQKKTV